MLVLKTRCGVDVLSELFVFVGGNFLIAAKRFAEEESVNCVYVFR